MMKRVLILALALMLCAPAVLAEGSWGQINQTVGRAENWQRIVTDSPYQLGEGTLLDGTDVTILGWGNYLSLDGSTVSVPMAMELARQLLDLPEEDLAGFVDFSTTHYAYERLIGGKPNPSVTVLSRNAMMDDTEPVRLFIGTEPSMEERAMAEEAGVELVLVPVCYDAFVFLVNSQNEINSLTSEQVRGIYSGRITNWAEVGRGIDVPIKAFQRPANSGSQTAMENMVMQGEELVAEPNYISDGMADLVEQVGSYNNGPDAIGYSYLYYVDALYKAGSLRTLAINGIAPTAENIVSGAYPYSVCYYAVYVKGDAEAAAFADWLCGVEGQRCIAQAGYITR